MRKHVLIRLACLLAVLPAAAQDWTQTIRALAHERRFADGLALVDGRLAANAADAEARAWRARLLAWSGRWSEAEKEYRAALVGAPQDVELLLSLADVVYWQGRAAEALTLLAQAVAAAPAANVLGAAEVRRGRILLALDRPREAQAAWERALALDPGNDEARAVLARLPRALRHLLRGGFDYDHLNYTTAAHVSTLSLRSQWPRRWTTDVSLQVHRRSGEAPARFSLAATVQLPAQHTLSFGAAKARDRGVIARSELFLEAGRGLRISETALLRGLELSLHAHAYRFRDGRVTALTPALIFYLPRDWTFALHATAARSRFTATPAEWRPSGMFRLGFPLRRQVSGQLFFGAGTENFARADQVGRFSARTSGGGVRWQATPRHDFAVYALHQDRSQERKQTSCGLSYGFRF